MGSRLNLNANKLFEVWCELRRVPSAEQNARTPSASETIAKFPENVSDETLHSIATLAFPCDFESTIVQLYTFVLTSGDAKWRFGFCRYDPKTDSTMIILTYLPWHDTFLKLLVTLSELRHSDPEEFKAFLTEAYKRGVPEPNCSIRLYYHNGQSQFVFDRPLLPRLPSIPESHNLNLYYNFVSTKNMIEVFAAMLAERKIIFTSRHLDRLSSCVHAAVAFLYPMEWQHIFIPLLPMKLNNLLGAPIPYIIGAPESVLATMMPEELGDVVILNCDTSEFNNPFDDVRDLPTNIVSQMKQQLTNTRDHIGDSISKIFLRVLVQLIGGYRDAVEFRDTGKKFNPDKFVESRPSHLRPYISKMMDLQIFAQFIDDRLEKLNAGLGISDEFETETVLYAEKMKKHGLNYGFFKNVKDKTNPAVKSAVKTVKQSTKTAYKDLKSKFRDITPPSGNNQHFRSHLPSNSHHDRIDGNSVGRSGSVAAHHSAPSSPIFNKRIISKPIIGTANTGGGVGVCKYGSPELLNGNAHKIMHRPNPLAISSSTAHMSANPHTHANHLNNHLSATPNVSPASSLCSSEMNLSQELQNHPLFKSPNSEQNPFHQLRKDTNQALSTSTSALPVSAAETNTSSNDLISLDDSKNSSFELEDFDPLNKNARPLPMSSIAKKSTTLPAGATPATSYTSANCVNNPLYPYFAPMQQQQQQQHLQRLAHVTTSAGTKLPQIDDDFELLRKYGLDQFSLQPNGSAVGGAAAVAVHSNGVLRNATATANTTSASTMGISNWTKFD